VGQRDRLHQPGLRQRSLHGHLHARHQTVLGQWRSDLQRIRHLGQRSGMQPSSLHEWCMHRGLQPGRDAVLGQRRPDLHRQRSMGPESDMRGASLRDRSLRGSVLAGLDALLGERSSAGLRRCWAVGLRARLQQSSVCRGRLHRTMQPKHHTAVVQRRAAARL
jgi:hypothetical protein